MVSRLVVEEGDLKGLVLSLENGSEWVIGRDPDVSQLVLEDPLASRKHIVCRQSTYGITVQNLSQTNPARLNDETLDDIPKLLRQGDTLKIGSEVLRFYDDSEAHIFEETNIPEGNSSSLPPPTSNESSLFDEDGLPDLADINFGLIETGRWLLKVINGPNNGAEFYMHADHAYTLGTDPHTCDIVFNDTSVSRQHAKITISSDDQLFIEDLKSRNGLLLNGNKVETKEPLPPNIITTIGTTSFVVYDREGEMQTIISPLLPSIVKVLQQEPLQKESPFSEIIKEQTFLPPPAHSEAPTPAPPPSSSINLGPLLAIFSIVGIFILGGIALNSLFKSQPVVLTIQDDTSEMIKEALTPYPSVRFSFNKSTGGLLLLGHVSSPGDKSQLIYTLQTVKSIKQIDDSGIIIDEGVWQEINSILSKNPGWKGITIQSPSAGQFILSGYLETRKQAEQLSDYISVNFPYLDLLKKQIVVEEDVISQIQTWLHDANFHDVNVKMANGEVIFSGTSSLDKSNQLQEIINKTKSISGVRVVNNYIKVQNIETGIVNLSNHYDVTGQSKYGQSYSVVINGRNLYEGDVLDGMAIKSIKSNAILLEKDGTKYRIDYNR